MGQRQRHGNVWLSSRQDGLWAWVEGEDGTVLAELDCPLTGKETAAVKAAVEFALDDNRRIKEDRRREDASYDERSEWRGHYNATRGVS